MYVYGWIRIMLQEMVLIIVVFLIINDFKLSFNKKMT